MNYSSRKYKAAMAMADGNEKLTKLQSLALSFGCFDKRPLMAEIARLKKAGYQDLALVYLIKKSGGGV